MDTNVNLESTYGSMNRGEQPIEALEHRKEAGGPLCPGDVARAAPMDGAHGRP